MKFRVRGPDGSSATIELDDNSTISQLRNEISQRIDLPAFELKMLRPPKTINLDQFDDELKIVDAGIQLHGHQVIANPIDIEGPLKHPLGTSSAESKPPAQTTKPSAQTTKASTQTARPQASEDPSSDPPEIPVPTHTGTLVLRVMPDDNSCLFRAIGFAIMGDAFDTMYELRSLIATTIRDDPEKYNKGILEKEPTKYCEWITREDSWGGAIELGILAQHFDVEICSISVQDGRVDRFNEGDFKTRIILVYSGIHYDCIALSPSDPPYTKADVPAELDRRVFDPGDDVVLTKALELCAVLRTRHYYTDTAGFTIRCNICGWKGNGEKGAQEHAMSTGHMNFGEEG